MEPKRKALDIERVILLSLGLIVFLAFVIPWYLRYFKWAAGNCH